jgi:hypothetical protein
MNFSKTLLVLSVLNLSFALSASEYEGRRTPCCNLKKSLNALGVACVALFATSNAQTNAVAEVVPQKVYQPTSQELVRTGMKCHQLRARAMGGDAVRLKDPLCINQGQDYIRGSLEQLFQNELAELSLIETTCPVSRNDRTIQTHCIPSARMIILDDLMRSL